VFHFLNKKRIDDIPTETFNLIIEELVSSGWKAQDKYKGHDAWIDYGKIQLTKDKVVLTFEWDNWTEGVIKGCAKTVSRIAKQYSLKSPQNVLF
jgi:hypothetical protein